MYKICNFLKKYILQNHTEILPTKNPTLKLGDKLNPRKRKVDNHNHFNDIKEHKIDKSRVQKNDLPTADSIKQETQISEVLKKKQDADKKRMESIRKKRQEFKEKKLIIKTGLVGVVSI